ncbi:MAG: outer membrane beta-barrel protein [Candidatus Aminicenantes bacterium]|jgi:hypothetical protein
MAVTQKISHSALRVFLFLILLFFISGNNIWAQFRVQSGATLSFAGEKSAIYNASNMFTGKAGLCYSFSVTEFLSIQPGIFLAMKGGRYYSARVRARNPAHLNYIEIPVLCSIRLLKETLDLYLGPYVGFLISSIEIDGGQDWTSIQNKIRNYDIGVSLGARCYIIKRVFVEIQFNHGLTKVVYDPNPAPRALYRFHKNKTLSLLVGFNI